MSVQRLATPAFFTTHAAVRAVQPFPSNTRQLCLKCLRPLPSRRKYPFTYQSQRYASQTARRPQQLATHESPPRNTGVPETSIAGGKPEVDFGRQRHTQQDIPLSSETTNAQVSIPESEAQKSRPAADSPSAAVGSVASETTASTSSQTKPQRKSKLRPRKAAMTLTPAAVAQLRGLLDQPEPKMIRVGVKNRGCSGLAYHLEYVDKPGSFDEAVDQDGVKVLVDSKALFSIIGSEMDWVEDKLNQRFVFNNPNIKEQCGCGESFSVG